MMRGDLFPSRRLFDMGYDFFFTVLKQIKKKKKTPKFLKYILRIQNPRKRSLGNDVEDTCAKFHRNRSMGKVFNVGGTI